MGGQRDYCSSNELKFWAGVSGSLINGINSHIRPLWSVHMLHLFIKEWKFMWIIPIVSYNYCIIVHVLNSHICLRIFHIGITDTKYLICLIWLLFTHNYVAPLWSVAVVTCVHQGFNVDESHHILWLWRYSHVLKSHLVDGSGYGNKWYQVFNRYAIHSSENIRPTALWCIQNCINRQRVRQTMSLQLSV